MKKHELLTKMKSILRKLPLDLGQREVRETTKGKLIALSLVKSAVNKKALDVGCREGTQSRWLQKKGYLTTSIDIVKEYDKALVVDIEKELPFEDGSFDLIWCSEVIEHVADPEFTLGEFRRVLKGGGDMIITTPNSYFILFIILNALGIPPWKLQREDHKQFFNYRQIRKLFPGADIYGYFPWAVVKLRIRKLIGLLSPTFVIHEEKHPKG